MYDVHLEFPLECTRRSGESPDSSSCSEDKHQRQGPNPNPQTQSLPPPQKTQSP